MGGGTPFEGMSHEAMLAWLDQANSGPVQGAADRLAAAAKEIRAIAEDLKVRPQWVEWKGAGADAFRTWSADLANATLRLGDFSEGSATWLGHASNAIASAQASIPRDAGSAQANLDAARSAHNDPDASAIARKSASELAALEADKEKVRQEAVAQMRKLGQAYEQASTQMNGLERPKFPPPPQAIAPDPHDVYGGIEYASGSSGTAERRASSGGATHSPQVPSSSSGVPDSRIHTGLAPADRPALADAQRPTRMDVDSTAVLPQNALPLSPVGNGLEVGHAGDAPAVRIPPPSYGAGLSASPGPSNTWPSYGEAHLSRRGPSESGHSTVRTPGGGPGIIGGRPVPSGPNRPNSSVPKGTVVGAEEPGNRGASRPVTGAGPAGQVAGRPGAMPGRSSTAPRRAVSGGSAQQSERAAGSRSVSSGAAPERGGVSGGRPVVGNAGGGAHGGQLPRGSRKGRSRRESDETPPGYLVEDDETWVRSDPRVVPPVID